MTTSKISRAERATPVYLVDPNNEQDGSIGTGYRSVATVTRPANTTAYAANDVVGAAAAAFELASIGPSGGHIMVTSVDILVHISSVPTGMSTFRLHLYDATPPSALADNAQFDIPSGDRNNYLGFISLDAPTDRGSSLHVQMVGVNQQYKLASGSSSLFAYLETVGGYTPNSASVYQVRLRAIAL